MDLKSVVSVKVRAKNRRPLLAGLCAGAVMVLALVVALASLALAASGFPDVGSSHPYFNAITDLSNRGIVSGYINGDFGPGDPVKRQQFAKMIVLTGGYPVSEMNVCPFSDVEISGPGNLFPDNYVAVCAANGITLGRTETTFDPYAYITRYQVVSMVVRTADNLRSGLLALPPAGWTGTGTWPNDPTHGANAARAEYNGLLNGLNLAGLNPLGNMTRGEVAQVLYNLLVKLGTAPPTTGTTQPPGTGYSLVTSASPTAGGTVTRSPDQASYAAGSTVTLTATPATGYKFSSWGGDAGGTTNPLSVTMNSNKTITAVFTPSSATYTLTVVISGSGTVTRNPAKATYNAGEAVLLTPVPAAGQTFSGWSGDASGTANPLTVVMDSNKTIVATFVAATYTLTTSVPGGHGIITRNPDQATFTAGATVTLTAVPASGYAFAGWSGDATGTTNPLTVTMNANKTIAATFVPTYTLTVTVAGGVGGTVTKSPSKSSYAAGETVTLTPVPAAGYVFNHWGGDATGTTNPLTITMNANKTITAFFTPAPKYTLTVTVSGGVGGTVTKSPSKTSYTAGDTVTLTANPATGYEFSYWSGDHIGTSSPVTITMDSNKTIYAHFKEKTKYTLSIYVSGGGGSRVTKSPAQSYYYEGQTVTVTAEPAAGYVFDYWSGDHIGVSTSFTIVMNSNKSIYAHFKALPRYTLTVSINGGGSSTVTKSPNQSDYYQGQTVTLTMHEASGYTFLYWGGDGGGAITTSITITMNGNKTVTAYFRRIT